jgi:hypothetical protein
VHRENATLTATVTNQLVGYGYDAAGNSDSGGGVTVSYNAESQMVSTSLRYSYVYDGDGNRVEKTNGTTGTLYWYGAPGIVAETDLAGNMQSEYLFFNGSHIALMPMGTAHHVLPLRKPALFTRFRYQFSKIFFHIFNERISEDMKTALRISDLLVKVCIFKAKWLDSLCGQSKSTDDFARIG